MRQIHSTLTIYLCRARGNLVFWQYILVLALHTALNYAVLERDILRC